MAKSYQQKVGLEAQPKVAERVDVAQQQQTVQQQQTAQQQTVQQQQAVQQQQNVQQAAKAETQQAKSVADVKQQQQQIAQQAQQVQQAAKGKVQDTKPIVASESSLEGKEVASLTQKQTQKEHLAGDLEATRHITTTDTFEQQHKVVTKEVVVKGEVEQAVPPAFTEKIQPLIVQSGEAATFKCKFTGQPPPKITWYREKFVLQNSRDIKVSWHFHNTFTIEEWLLFVNTTDRDH